MTVTFKDKGFQLNSEEGRQYKKLVKNPKDLNIHPHKLYFFQIESMETGEILYGSDYSLSKFLGFSRDYIRSSTENKKLFKAKDKAYNVGGKYLVVKLNKNEIDINSMVLSKDIGFSRKKDHWRFVSDPKELKIHRNRKFYYKIESLQTHEVLYALETSVGFFFDYSIAYLKSNIELGKPKLMRGTGVLSSRDDKYLVSKIEVKNLVCLVKD